jgi:hypothetical protein
MISLNNFHILNNRVQTMKIGYWLSGTDNKSDMFYSDDPGLKMPEFIRFFRKGEYYNDPDLKICSNCGYVTNYDYVNPNFRVKIRQYDFSYTYDGRCIISLKFKEFCKRNKYKNIEFIKLPSDVDFFYFKVYNVLEVNEYKQSITREKYCEFCKQYESVVITTPSKSLPLNIFYINHQSLIDDNFYSANIQFGGGNNKSQVIIIGFETAEKLKREKMKGILFRNVEN